MRRHDQRGNADDGSQRRKPAPGARRDVRLQLQRQPPRRHPQPPDADVAHGQRRNGSGRHHGVGGHDRGGRPGRHDGHERHDRLRRHERQRRWRKRGRDSQRRQRLLPDGAAEPRPRRRAGQRRRLRRVADVRLRIQRQQPRQRQLQGLSRRDQHRDGHEQHERPRHRRHVVVDVHRSPRDRRRGRGQLRDRIRLGAELPARAAANPPGGTTPGSPKCQTPNEAYTYSANDASVGDVDGDGGYEIILKWDPSNAKDNSQAGCTGNVFLDAYRLDGTRLWRIDLGRNIRAGAHYTQFLVYDFDGDGRAEMACKTAPGTQRRHRAVPAASARRPATTTARTIDLSNSAASGYILTGPEFLTVFNGETGAELATVNFTSRAARSATGATTTATAWTASSAGVAYLDGTGRRASSWRAATTRAPTLTAWDCRNGRSRSAGCSTATSPRGSHAYTGQGDHSLSVADVDADDGAGDHLRRDDHRRQRRRHVLDRARPRRRAARGRLRSLARRASSCSCPRGGAHPGATCATRDTCAIIWQGREQRRGPGRGVADDIFAGNAGAEIWASGADGRSRARPAAARPSARNPRSHQLPDLVGRRHGARAARRQPRRQVRHGGTRAC